MTIEKSNLKTLKGCPQKVVDYFSVTDCNQLTTLEYAPIDACNVYIVRNNKLKSLKGLPQNGAMFYIWDNGKDFELSDVKKVIKDVETRIVVLSEKDLWNNV